jgi:hypothetical protein
VFGAREVAAAIDTAERIVEIVVSWT